MPIGPPGQPQGSGDGYSYEPGALRQITGHLQAGAESLDRVVTTKAAAVDAGASSDIVGEAMARLQKIGAIIAHTVDDTAGKVHAADGSYDEIENTNEGAMQYREENPRGGRGGNSSIVGRIERVPLDHEPREMGPR